jgi:hypothetical protein
VADEIEADPDNPMNWCCAGAAMWGPSRCTCWVPIFSKVQRELDASIEPGTRSEQCADCAYRQDSAEQQDYRADQLRTITHSDEAPFWCHQGMRYEVGYRHPSGMYVEAQRDEVGSIASWAPPLRNGVPFKANGTPADRCAGWAARRRVNG